MSRNEPGGYVFIGEILHHSNKGDRTNVRQNEGTASPLVTQHSPALPVPQVFSSIFRRASNGLPTVQLCMSYIEGRTLASEQLRQIHRPKSLNPPEYYSNTKGSHFLGCYVKHNGLSYVDGKDLPGMLSRPACSVFTHGDIRPGNILVNKQSQIVGLLDWENAGFYPDYWEYAMTMRLMPRRGHEWQAFMKSLKPKNWDITGIEKARRGIYVIGSGHYNAHT
ncbi:kinase-like protein [Phialemonium atrogriseum]|uniref:Kinase-like protein n=1 Tax=Phialemonium atrogriseum TaxID=1093897 RepID=A0AAJ0C7J0_9PEZI|nr:kinase-like protein [Phialemonium atrogriseum]KAK1771406.1 kinase-like protein [Phialemonium atrogriseum]